VLRAAVLDGTPAGRAAVVAEIREACATVTRHELTGVGLWMLCIVGFFAYDC